MATTKNISVNRVRVSGNICRNANKSASGNFAGFELAHNASRKGETMFDKVKMYNKNGKQDIEIPFDVLVKGRRILVEGYRVKIEETDKDGKVRKQEYIIALNVTDYPWLEDKSNPSVNEVEVSGNLYADAKKSASGNFAGFDLAHNGGKNRLVLGDKVKLFAKQDETLPFDELFKGNRVLVKGYRRAEKETYITKEGTEKTVTRTVLVATEVTGYPWDAAQGEEQPSAEESVDLPMATAEETLAE